MPLDFGGVRSLYPMDGRVVLGSTEGASWQVLDGVTTTEVLVFGPDDCLWTGDGQRWRPDDAGRFEPAPPSDATWQPWCWSASGERVLGQFGRRQTGSLALYDRSGAFVAPLAAGSRDAVGRFEGEELVLLRLGQIWRYSASLPLAFVHPPRAVEWDSRRTTWSQRGDASGSSSSIGRPTRARRRPIARRSSGASA